MRPRPTPAWSPPVPTSMRGHLRPFDLVFAALAGLLVLVVVLPLAAILLGTSPGSFLLAFGDPEVVAAIALTFTAGALATGAGALTGVPLAYLLARRRFRGRGLVEAIINLPLVIPHTAAGIALLLVFGRRGLLGSAMEPLGVTFTDTLAGTVVAMLFVSLPFLVNMSLTAFAGIDPELEQAAFTDGAGPWQVFRSVALPLARRGVFSGMLMMWARGISEFGAVVIIAYHPKIAPVLVYERFSGFGLDAALPVAAILVVAALVVFTTLRLIVLPERGT
jgi:molybdate/tungstate transport system permease protein